jgi:hypothetical protein
VKNLHHGANHKIDAKVISFHMDTKIPRGLGDDEAKIYGSTHPHRTTLGQGIPCAY